MQLKVMSGVVLAATLTACGGGGGVNNIVPGTPLKTPTMTDMKTAATVYLNTALLYNDLINTSLGLLPRYNDGFELGNFCTDGGAVTLNEYKDNDNDQMVSKGDTYSVTFANCKNALGTFVSGSVTSTINNASLLMPDFNDGINLTVLQSWTEEQTLVATNVLVSEGAVKRTLNGAATITAAYDSETAQYHSAIKSSNLNLLDVEGTNNTSYALSAVNFDYIYNRNTQVYKMDHDVSALYSTNGVAQEASFNTNPVFSGTSATVGFGIPTSGQLLVQLTDYKAVTLVPQADGQNVSVDIADDGLNAVLMTWVSLGLATAQ